MYKKFICQKSVVVLANFPVLLKMYQVGKQQGYLQQNKESTDTDQNVINLGLKESVT